MITADTNVLVRLLTQDDPAQYALAYALFRDRKIYLPATIILETEWVLRFAYQFPSEQINRAFLQLFGLSNVTIENPEAVSEALQWHANGLDFPVALHLAFSRGSEQFFTFDKKLVNKASNLVDVPVVMP